MGALSNTQHSSAWLTARQWPDSVKPLSMMDRLFNRMDGSYPHKWRSAFANAQAIQNWREAWAEAFDEEGLTPEEVKAGIVTCRKLYDWPPSLPEFLKACRPAIDPERAFHEAVEQMRLRDVSKDAWSSPVVFWAAVQLGSDLRNNPYPSISKRWAAALDTAAKKIKLRELPNEVPPRLDALPAPGRQSVDPEQAAANIDKLYAMLGGRPRPFFAFCIDGQNTEATT